MLPSEVRRRVLGDHASLRTRLEEIEELVHAIEEGAGERVASLRLRGVELLEALEHHMQWEDRQLVPVLRDSDSWGPERVRRFDAEHREQREVLRHVLRALSDRERPAPLVARNLHDFAVLLRADMEEEERAFLDPRVVRDDTIGIDVETG